MSTESTKCDRCGEPFMGLYSVWNGEEHICDKCTAMAYKSDPLTPCAKCEELKKENRRLNEQLEESMMDMVNQSCVLPDGSIDSMAISTYADAMRFLAERKRLIIDSEGGRRVIGHWAPKEET
jgi:hypothetical protein